MPRRIETSAEVADRHISVAVSDLPASDEQSAVPKGSSIALDDAALLDKPSPVSSRCVVSGLQVQSHHHHPFRSSIPKSEQGRIPVFPVYGTDNVTGVHGLFHHHDLRPKWSDKHGWWFVATEAGARKLNRWRAKAGLTPVRAGREFPAFVTSEEYDDECPERLTEADGELLAAIRAKLEEASSLEGTLAWTEGQLLLEARAIIEARCESRAEVGELFSRYTCDDLHMDKATVSKRMTFASVLPESAADLGAARGYEVARAVRDNLLSLDEAVSLGRLLSVSDFRKSVRPSEDKTDKPLCPTCGRAWKGANNG